MELELGLKITKTRDDISSISEYQLAKDKGPVFQSRETNTTFILTAHLKGYKRNNIDIKISKDGNKITISGEKPIQEMVMVGWVMHKKVVNVTGFNKVFKIPKGVNLDRIKANYDEDEWILSIVMPKLVKGICGLRIEEVKEEEFDKRISEKEKNETDHVSSSVGETSQRGSIDNVHDNEECLAQQSGESKQKIGEFKCENDDRLKENMEESSKMEPCEAMKVSKVDDQNVVDHIPSNIGDIRPRQKELEDSRMQQKEKTKSIKGKIDGGQHEKTPNEANKDVEKAILGDIIQKDNIKPKTETDNEDQECVREKPVKEEGSVAMVGIREQFPKTTLEESEELSLQKMQENKDVKEEMIKRKKKETEYFEEKGEGERQKTVHVDANKDTSEAIEADNEKRKNGIEESGQHVGENTVKGRFELPKQLVELDGSKGFKVTKEEKKKELIKEEKAETESLMEKQEEESKKRNEEADKMHDDANKEINEERIKKVGESKMGIGEGNGKGVRKKFGKEEHEAMRTSELDKDVGACIPWRIEDANSQDKDTEVRKMARIIEKEEGRVSNKMLDGVNVDQTSSTIKKGREESKLMNTEDGKVEGITEKTGKAAYETLKASEREQDVGTSFPQNIGDIGKELEDQEMEEKGSVVEKAKIESDNMLHDTNKDLTKKIEKSKFGIEEGRGKFVNKKVGKEGREAKPSELEKNLGACTTQNTGITSQGISEDTLIQQSGKSKQKEFGESKCEFEDKLKENMKKSSMEPWEEVKGSKLHDQNVLDHIPSNTVDISQKELEELRIQQREKTRRNKGDIVGEKYARTNVDGNKDVEKTIFGNKIETENEDQECVREKASREGSDSVVGIREKFPKHLPKTTLEESEALNLQKMQEMKDVKEEMIKRKRKEIEYFEGKGEGERHKTMHVEGNKGIARDTIEEEIEKKKYGVDESGQQHVGENIFKGRFELPKSITEVETNEDIAEEVEKPKFGIEEGGGGGGGGKSVEENVGKEGCEAMKSSELEKNVGTSSTQISGVRSQGVFEEYLTQQSGDSKQKQFRESKCEAEDRLKEIMKRKNDDGQYEKEPVEANKDVENTVFGEIVQKNITKPKIETENEDQECDREKPGNERSDAKVAPIREKIPKHFPKPTLEENEDLNIQKLKEIKDVKEEMIKRKGKEIEYFVEKGEGERHKTKHGEENKGIPRERMQEKVEKKNNGVDESGNQHRGENIVKKVFEVPNSITEELPKQLEELDGSKELKVAKEEEQKGVTEEATPETDILMETVEESNNRNEEESRDAEKSTVIETLLKKTEGSNIGKNSSDEPLVQEKLPKQVVEAISQDEKDKNEHGIMMLEGKGSIEMHVEPNEAFENDTNDNRIEKEIRKQKLESGDQLNLKENVDNGIFDGRKRQKFPGMEEAEDAKEDGAKNEGYVKKVAGEKYEKIHVERNEDLKKDITKRTRWEETKDPKGEHHLHEEMSKERSQQSKAAKELNIRKKLPRHLPKTTLEESEELGVQEMQEIKDAREEMIKRKGKDTEHFVEKGEGKRHKTMHVDANKGIKRETIEDDMGKRKNAIEESGQQHPEKNTAKGRFELPKKLVELDGSKGFKVGEEEEQQEMIKAEKDETECFPSFMEKGEGKESKKINEVAEKVLDDANKEIREKRIKKEVGEPKKGIGDGNGKGMTKKVGKEKDEVMMEIVGVCIPQRSEDTTSKDKKAEVQKMDGSRSVEKKDGKEEFPKHLPKATLEESEELNVQKMQEIKDVKEEMIKRKGKEIEYSEERAEGLRHKTMHVEENKGITTETMQEKIEKIKYGVDESGQQHVGENIVKGVFEVPKSITEELPKQLEELDGSKELNVAKDEEQKEVTKEAMDETENLREKKEGEESKKSNEEASSGTEKSRVIETLLKKLEESNVEKKSSDGPFIKEKLPKKVVEEIAEAEKDKTEHGRVKLKGKESIKMHVEPHSAFENDTAGNRIEKDARKQKHESSDQSSVKEIVNNEIFDGIKRQNFPKMEQGENAKEDGAKIEQSVKKVNGDKYEKIQVEANEDFKKDITKETKGKEIEDPKMSKEISQESKSARNDPFKDTVQKEKEEPKILKKVKDQQCLQEDMSKGRYEASTATRQFPMQLVDSLAKTRERPKNKETKEAEEAKGDLAKRKSGEIKAVESRTKEKFQGTESENTQILHEAPKEKHPKAFEIGNPERELQSERGHTTSAKVVNMGLKEAEQGRAKDKKQKTRQHDFKPKQTKVGEQHNYKTEGTKEVAAKEDQEIKPSSSPWFPPTMQSEDKEQDKFYEGGKAKYEASRESQKKDLTKDMQNFIEMKENQEGKQKEALKPEIPLEKHPKKGELVIRTGEFHKGKNVGEKMQEKTEGPKKKIEDRNQQYVAIDVGKVESIEEEISKEYKEDAGSIAERIETKKDLKTTHEREDDMPTQNIDDEKPEIHDEIIKADIAKVNKEKCILESMKTTQEKDQPIKSEAVEKETESLEATSSLPNVTSMGVKEESPKKEIEDLHQKELSPLKAEMKSKEPHLELEKPVIQWKLPKTKEHVPLTELRDKEQHSYFTKEIEEQKITAYEGAKPQQSTDEENRKSENDVEEHKASKESPRINTGITEQIDSFQPQVLENEYFEEHQFNEQDETLDQCEFQGQKNLNEDRGQQHVQDNNDNKGSQTPKDVQEEMFMKEREGSKVAKSGEPKDSSRNKRERGKTTNFPEAKKPKMKEKTSHFEEASGSKQVADKMHETEDREHQIVSEEVTSNSKVRAEPPTMIEKIPNKEVERKEPHEITWPNLDNETPQISEVQEEKEGERHVHALEESISKEELAQVTATHSNTKSEVEPKGDNEIDKPQVNQLPPPSIEMLSKESQESEECSMKECDSNSKGETIVQVSDKKEPIHSTEVSVKEESQEAKKDSKTDVQERNKGKREQQCINKEEEKYGINEIEEKASEEGLEEQKEYKEEASGGKKDDTTMPKKLLVPLVIAGSALLGGIFIWHRRTRKR